MEIIVKKIIFVCLVLIISGVNAKDIKISTGEYPPYTGKKEANGGCVNHIIKTVFEKAGHKVKFRYMPWKRVFSQVVNGKYPVASFFFPKEERKEGSYYPSADSYVSKEDYYLYFLEKKQLEEATMSVLKGKKVIINRGYSYNEEFFADAKKYEVELIEVDKESQNLVMVGKKRGIATLLSEKVAEKYLEEYDGKEKIVKSKEPLISVKGYPVFTKKGDLGKKLAEDFDKHYEDAIKAPELEKSKKTCFGE